ncbi:hypothetical protein VTN96DRAFT_3297 [Rasamsonia emersonii]|uniref:AB hydrolase-1 domain-containing protein n=1 Tax=Rasamsonia emersonii (strain ATCC 16479 / CBS 393.64 / IMI 116815) TaxID=1408163 RepID=A0A0F4Z5X0_RASE3|nr:hypothetical protein T310_0016 [Rasamsonia emersonii CBS 393.64]KKA25944.1 hypothetical protein T310_0016 [Rasamsonia emersonii CBS 393.64]
MPFSFSFSFSFLSLLAFLSCRVLAAVYPDPANDFSCHSAIHPNPVILLHGLGATYYEDLNYLGDWLRSQNFCVFSLTYGAYEGLPPLGGLLPVNESAAEIASFVRDVHDKTNNGTGKVDLVGHSEGAFQTLYVPKFEGVAPLIDHVVAIAPPTHGTSFAGLVNLAYALGGNATRELVSFVLNTVGCHACDDLADGGWAIAKLNDGQPIAQAGNSVTVLMSQDDELVTPPSTSVVDEPGVTNLYVQDVCPSGPVGHIGEAYDLNVWNLVLNALEDTPDRTFSCTVGAPVFVYTRA